ncbi:SUKH-3 domain-containing protein [Promicromonospora kroppenstedtii]|uniref:SUKH-3 domain-containing protein n=1 Tax=Promicromonospora kroppenstedtii TaxID=440482 RepID=A0ABW7XSE5_9MICO
MFDEFTAATLTKSGWFPGRAVDVDRWAGLLQDEGIELHAAAVAFLREFGGLVVDESGPGISRAREPFILDPAACDGEGDRFLEWSEELGRRIVPVGELDQGRFLLGLDETSELYLVETFVATFGRMPAGLERLVRGVMPAAPGTAFGP